MSLMKKNQNNKNNNSADLTKQENFSRWRREILRFSDLDQNDHVNNVSFADFAQSGRVDLLKAADKILGRENVSWMLVNVNINFLGEVHFPGEIKIGSAVTKIGNSSLHIGQGIFVGDRCVATVDNVMVRVDTTSKRPSIISPELRDLFHKLAPLGA